MSDVTADVVKHVSTLARLELNENEVSMYQKDLAKILDHVGELEKVDTKGVEDLNNPMRENLEFYQDMKNAVSDETKNSLSNEEVLKNAPEKSLGQFKVEAFVEVE